MILNWTDKFSKFQKHLLRIELKRGKRGTGLVRSLDPNADSQLQAAESGWSTICAPCHCKKLLPLTVLPFVWDSGAVTSEQDESLQPSPAMTKHCVLPSHNGIDNW